MVCPLPGWNESVKRTGNGNRGLYFNKYFNRWKWDQGNNPVVEIEKVDKGDGKAAWIKACGGRIGIKTDDPPAKYAARIKDVAESAGGWAENYVSQGPFVTGIGLPHPVENGFTWHHTLGVPYLPASSIKGMMRAWARDWKELDCSKGSDIARLLGTVAKEGQETEAGALIVFDALPVGDIELYLEVLTPHIGQWRLNGSNPPADWISPVPVPFLAVKEGAKFQFAFGLRKGGTKEYINAAFTLLSEALDWIGAGAKTSVGFGRMLDKDGHNKAANEKKRRLERWAAEDAAVAAAPVPRPAVGTVIPAGREIILDDDAVVTLTVPFKVGVSSALQVRTEDGRPKAVSPDRVIDWNVR